ncbi:hypothetical protein RhiirC2_777840 [Rhizophagus irregularis]|uniref:Helitron helicase-like domain-containing protein n=1 Tax=Rhizophagus irregularis TaxID=588596 RepID=A0A2N1NDM6_9GLOM|nr:hypothetical protein RhiirC2_777840 [Rhizophagus irregularis]
MFIPLMPQHNEKNLKEEQINISDIQEMIANRDNIADHIMRYGEGLDKADGPWIELHLLMENNNHSEDEAESSKYRQQNIIDNLHIATWFFKQRFETFFNNMLINRWELEDYWYQYEWQHRRSVHVHGIEKKKMRLK